MAKYTQVAVSGYNATPPADDGSQVSANKVLWATIKTKLGDPLNTAASSLDTNILSAFTKVFLARTAAKTTTFSVASTEDGYSYVCTNTITANLPAAANVYAGFTVLVLNFGSGTVTLDGSGAETVGGAATKDISAGDWAIVQSDGTNWNYIASSAFSVSASHTFSKAQIASATALTSSSNHIALDLSLNNNFTHTFTENTTLDNPTNIAANQSGRIYLTQHASSPKTLAYGSYYKFPNAVTPTVTASNSAIDVLFYDVLDSTHIACNLVKGFA